MTRAIVSSVIESDVDLGNGQRSVLEVHTDDAGQRYEFRVYAATGFDVEAQAAARALTLPARLAEIEKRKLAARVEAGEDPTSMELAWMTRNDALRYLIKRLANDKPERVLKFAPLIGKLTDAQIASLLGVTEQQIADWRAKIVSLKQSSDAYDSGLSYDDVREPGDG